MWFGGYGGYPIAMGGYSLSGPVVVVPSGGFGYGYGGLGGGYMVVSGSSGTINITRCKYCYQDLSYDSPASGDHDILNYSEMRDHSSSCPRVLSYHRREDERRESERREREERERREREDRERREREERDRARAAKRVGLFKKLKATRSSLTTADLKGGILPSGKTFDSMIASAEGEYKEAEALLEALKAHSPFPNLSFDDLLAHPTGQSVVFKGTWNHQSVAVKMFRTRGDEAAEREVQFLRECGGHDGVMSILAEYEHLGRKVLVFPIAEGDLAAREIIDDGNQAVNYAKQIASGLAHMHHKGIAHLDIKAQNILVFPDGKVRLTDFGLASKFASSAEVLKTSGTYCFIAPEVWGAVAEGTRRGDYSKVDVYAYGCLLWQLLAGQPPFERESAAGDWKVDDYVREVYRNRKSPADMIDDYWRRDGNKRKICDVIRRCCAYEPHDRPSMDEILGML